MKKLVFHEVIVFDKTTYKSTVGFGFPWTWSIIEAVESRMTSDSRSLTMKTGA